MKHLSQEAVIKPVVEVGQDIWLLAKPFVEKEEALPFFLELEAIGWLFFWLSNNPRIQINLLEKQVYLRLFRELIFSASEF